MKCVFQFWSCSPHLEASLEIAMTEALSGNQVKYFWGGDDVLFSENNGQGKLGHNFKSQKPIFKAIRLLKRKIGDPIEFITSWVNYGDVPELPDNFQTLEGLFDFRHENFDVGRAAISSLSHLFLADLTKEDVRKLSPMLEEIIFSGIGVYNSALNLLKECDADHVYVFNGRFIHEAAVHAAASKLGIKVSFHERGSTLDKFMLVDHLVHDVTALAKSAQEAWQKELEKSNDVVFLAKKYLDNRIYSATGPVQGSWKNLSQSFDRKMSLEKMRQEIGICNENYFVFFQSSDDEYAAVSKSIRVETEWQSQEDVVAFLAEMIDKKITLVVRLHPHMKDKNPCNLQSWMDLEKTLQDKGKNIKFVWQDSNVNSYLLASGATKVICCGSTIGAEAIYLGKQTICCGLADWSGLEGATEVLDYDSLGHALRNDCVIAPESILPIAYYRSTFGREYKYFKSTGIYSGDFLGVDLFNGQSYVC